MGLSDKGDRISGLGGIGVANYRREQDSPFRACNCWLI